MVQYLFKFDINIRASMLRIHVASISNGLQDLWILPVFIFQLTAPQVLTENHGWARASEKGK